MFIILIFTNVLNFSLNEQLRKVSEIIFPSPKLIHFGDLTYSFNKICSFSFDTSSIKFSNEKSQVQLKELISVYDKIINRKLKSNISNSFSPTRSFLPSYGDYCKYLVNLNSKFSSMKLLDDDYDTSTESYELLINPVNNSLFIEINSVYLNGLVRGLETFSQILYLNKTSSQLEIPNLPLVVQDEPDFIYRGVMIDTSRHFIQLNKIKEIIDGMMYNKLNVLHWHLTDDEYFGFQTDLFNNSYKNNNYDYVYSKSSIEDIINYAHTRAITVLPEIDTPSHTRSWKFVDPEIVITKPEYGSLDPSKNLTYDTVAKILNEVIDTFSKNTIGSGRYYHLGGDEVLSEMWNSSEILSFMKYNQISNVTELENYYFNRIRNLLPEENNYIYWISDQSKKFYDAFSLPNSVMMYWGLFDKLKSYLDTFSNQDIKRKLILTPGDYLYLDCGSGNKYGNITWCGEYKTWKKIYEFPIFNDYKNFSILGSQVVLFGELADDNSIVGKIFPRASSLSEILWRNQDRNSKLFFLKLIHQNRRLKERDISTVSFTTLLCENEPQECLDKIV
jgi:hexosaminidase